MHPLLAWPSEPIEALRQPDLVADPGHELQMTRATYLLF
jgi:hypothetical protein